MKSMYKKLEGILVLEKRWGEEEKNFFGHVWKSPVPSKVMTISWKLFLDRIPTRSNLIRRNAIPSTVSPLCVLCDSMEKNELLITKLVFIFVTHQLS